MAIKKLDLLRVITSSNYLYNFSSSYSNKAKTASYALNASGGGGSSLRTGSTYPITASYANRAITASYALNASGGGGSSLRTGSTYPITASYASRAITASYALNASGGGSSLAGAQTFVSNGSQTVYTLNQSVVNRDQILVVTNGVVQSRTGSNYTVSGTTLTLSEAVQNGGLVDVRYINAGQGSSGTSGTSGAGSTLGTGSTYPITSSYARKAITASYLTTISQSLIPAKNNVYSLGSPTKKWKDIYVSTSSIYFDNYSLRVAVKNNSPQLLFNTSSIVTVPSGSNTNTASYATNALNSVNSLDIPKIKSIIYTNSSYTPTTASAVDTIKPNTNYITISGSNFKPSASVFIDSTSGSVVTYVNSTKLNVNVVSKNEGTYPIYLSNVDGASTFKINAITYITSLDQFQYVVVAGGGGGGIAHAGGGGAGGFRTGSLGLNRAVTYSVSIGSGGATSPSRSVNGTNGSNSVFASITSIGGGGGGSEYKGGNSGGSGGGGATGGPPVAPGGSGSLLQGNSGGAGSPSNPPYIGGGGGGAGAVGGTATPTSAGNGGIGGISSITGTSTYYAGGGGGGAYGGNAGVTSAGTGGLGGGGNGNYGNGNGSAGTTNRGGGGGGGGYSNENGYNGGSGIVILKYLSSRTLTIGVGLTSSTVTTGSYKITTFTAGSDTIIIS